MFSIHKTENKKLNFSISGSEMNDLIDLSDDSYGENSASKYLTFIKTNYKRNAE